jgi:uncharacterized protein YegL
MGLLDSDPMPRKTMVLFFVVDTSGSMAGSKMGSVNEAIHDVLPEMKEISANNADAQIKIAALQFSSGSQWLYDKPMDAENFRWNDLQAGGVTDLGEACKQLNQKLTRKEGGFMNELAGSATFFPPVIILLSDGDPTDNWNKELDNLKGNNWFKNSLKIAIAIGSDANQDVLKEFTGHSELVLTAHDPETLKRIIRVASKTASQIGSRSSTGDTKEETLIKTLNNDPDIQTTSSDVDIDDW